MKIRNFLSILILLCCVVPAWSQATNNSNAVQGLASGGTTAKGNPVQIGGVASNGNVYPALIDSSGHLWVNIYSTVLPSGAATSANQATEITDLGSILSALTNPLNVNGTFWPYSLGQQLAAGSVPVVLTAAQLSALTPLSSVGISNWPSTLGVTGTFWQATQPVSIATMPTTPVTGTFWQTTQPVSLASVPLPSGAATSTNQATEITDLGSILSAITSPLAVTGTFWPYTLGQQLASGSIPIVLTASQLSALTPLSSIGINNWPSTFGVTGTFWQTTQPISAISLPLPTGASTSALQTSGNSSLSTIATNIPAQGQALAAASMPVVLPSSQITALTPPTSVTANAGTNLNTSALAVESGGNLASLVTKLNGGLPAGLGTGGGLKVDGSGTALPISASSLPLPTGAATSSLQTTGNTSLSSIATNTGNIPVPGQGTTTTSMPVVLPSSQITALTPPAAITGFSTSANQTNGTQQSQITDATTVANVLPASGSPTGAGALQVATAQQTQTFSFNSLANGTSYDVSGYSFVSVQIAGFYTGTTPTVNFQQSNDNSTWVTLPLYPSSVSGGNSNILVSGATVAGIYSGGLQGRYFRITTSGTYTSGTTTGTIVFKTLAPLSLNQTVNLNAISGIGLNIPQPVGASGNLGTALGGAVSNVDIVASTSIASTAYTGSTIIPTYGGGPSMSALINTVVTTIGSCTGIQWHLQQSEDNGTTWHDIWSSKVFTTTGTIVVPEIKIAGRRRWTTTTLNGVAPTTATATVTVSDLSDTCNRYFDYTDYTANVLNGTSGNATTAYYSGGASSLMTIITLSTTTTAGTYQLQVGPTTSGPWATVGTIIPVANTSSALSISQCPCEYFRLNCSSSGTSQTGVSVELTASN